MNHTVRELAENVELWIEYVNSGEESSFMNTCELTEMFNGMSLEFRMETLITLFPNEIRENDVEALSMINKYKYQG